MSPTPTNPTTTPIDCAEPGCTWAVRGVPDKYARIMARDHAAEHAGQASSTATETAVDRVPLRDRIRRAVCEAEGFAWDTDMLEPDEYGEVADAVMAVLPAPAVDVADLRDRITTAISKWHRDPEQSLYSQGADAVLAVLAAEAQQQQPETEAAPYPPEVRWIAQELEGGDEWMQLASGADRGYVEGRLTSYRTRSPQGLTTRLIRKTTTYTVEQLAPALTEAPVSDADRIVAYRNTHRTDVLLCREHGEGWMGLTPLTSEDLPDGGLCTWGMPFPDEVCGRDILAAPAVTEEPTP